jgi:glycosyltransferase involved in cell wall biosynthesis
MKVAIVCDWLTVPGGAEKVLLAVHQMFPEAPIYTSKYDKKGIDWFLDADVRTGWLQIFPSCLRRFLAPLRQRYFSHLDLSEYDLIISVTGAEAKSIKKGNATHVCYCHVPTQYYWEMYDDYIKNPGFGILNPLARLGLKLGVKPLRKADFKAAQQPDYFVTISSYAADMIKQYYKREATVIAPPVEVEKFHNSKSHKRSGFINFSRQVSWKRQDLIVKACIKAGKEVTLIGDGPEHEQLVKYAGNSPLVHFIPFSEPAKLHELAAKSEAFIFPSKEPFGIAPVEALAAGCPVIAYSEGGALDYVHAGKNGEFFKEQSVDSLVKALKKFDGSKYSEKEIVKSADAFSATEFKRKLQEFIDEKMAK